MKKPHSGGCFPEWGGNGRAGGIRTHDSILGGFAGDLNRVGALWGGLLRFGL